MRIGNVILDTDNMTADEISTLIRELREIRSRKLERESLLNGMRELLQRAEENHFYFVTDSAIVQPNDIEIFDEPN